MKEILISIIQDCPNLERLEILYTRKRIKLRNYSKSSSPLASNNSSINPSPTLEVENISISRRNSINNTNKSIIKSRVNSPTPIISSTSNIIDTEYKVGIQNYSSNANDDRESNIKTCVFATPRVSRTSLTSNDNFTTPAIKNSYAANLSSSFATPAVQSFNNSSNALSTTPLVRSSSPTFMPHTLMKTKMKPSRSIDLTETFSSSPISGSYASQLEFNVKNNRFLEATTFRLLLEKNAKLQSVTVLHTSLVILFFYFYFIIDK